MKGKSDKCPPKAAPKSAVKGRRMAEGGKLDVDWGAKWQHAALNLLRPEDYERLAAAVNYDAATPSGSR